MSYIKFHINSRVRVRLTALGKQCHRKNHKDLYGIMLFSSPPTYRPPKEDSEGYSVWQFWELMEEFGPHIDMGSEPLFELGDIEIEKL